MDTPGSIPPLPVAVMTDGRAGNEAQAMGLAEALGRRRPVSVEVRRAGLEGLRALPPAQAWHLLGRIAPATAIRALGDTGALPRPGLVIGAGRRVAPLVALAARRDGVPSVQMLDPQMPARAFGLVVAPFHDGLRGERVLGSLGALGRVTPERIAAEAEEWAPRLRALSGPRLAVLVGGPGKMARWGDDDPERLRMTLRRLADAGWTLLVTTSRRTPKALSAALTGDLDPARHLIHTGGGANPYPAMLGHAEAVLVTEDSVNMASEAASGGLPLHVFRVSGASEKARAFHVALASRGIARDFDGRIASWTYSPLAEADRIAAEVDARLLSAA